MSAIMRSRRTGRVLHRTFTSPPRSDRPAAVFCVICGWFHTVDPFGGRGEARAHLRWPDEWPVFHCGVVHDTISSSSDNRAAVHTRGAPGVASPEAVRDDLIGRVAVHRTRARRRPAFTAFTTGGPRGATPRPLATKPAGVA